MQSNETHGHLEKLYKQLRWMQGLCVALVAIGIVTFFFNKLWAILPFSVAIAVRFLFHKKKKAYRLAFMHVSVENTLDQHLKESRHLTQAPITADSIREVCMLPCDSAKNAVTCCEGGIGRYEDYEVRLTGATFVYTYTYNNKKRTDYTVGTWVRVKLHEDTGMDCRLLSVRTVPDPILKDMLDGNRELQVVPNPIGLTKDWHTVCKKDNTELPNKSFLRLADRLYEASDGHAVICVQRNILHIMLEDKVLAQDIDYHVPPEKAMIPDLLPNLSIALRLTAYLS